ncbi:unnamed protein product, partial [Closterium sp. Yama58-4]
HYVTWEATTRNARGLCITAGRPETPVVRCTTALLSTAPRPAALSHRPSLASELAGIWVAGGSFFASGDVNAAAEESQVFADPEAADQVLTSGANIHVLGLNVTTQVALTGADLSSLCPQVTSASPVTGESEHGTASLVGAASVGADTSESEREHAASPSPPAASLVGRLVNAYRAHHQQSDHMDGIFLHDACAVAAIMAPSLFSFKRGSVRVECTGVGSGCTLMDYSLKNWNGPNPWASIAISQPSLKADAALLASLSRFRHLTSLTINKCVFDKDNDAFLRGLGSVCPRLIYLDLNNGDSPGVTYEGLDAIFTGCTALQYLSLTMMTVSSDTFDRLPDSLVSSLSSLKALTIRDCRDFNLLSDSLCDLSNLRTLVLKDCSALWDLPESMDRLSSLEHLELRLERHTKTCPTYRPPPALILPLTHLHASLSPLLPAPSARPFCPPLFPDPSPPTFFPPLLPPPSSRPFCPPLLPPTSPRPFSPHLLPPPSSPPFSLTLLPPPSSPPFFSPLLPDPSPPTFFPPLLPPPSSRPFCPPLLPTPSTPSCEPHLLLVSAHLQRPHSSPSGEAVCAWRAPGAVAVVAGTWQGALSHMALSHRALSHMALSHRALSHMALSHMALSHRALSHMALSHRALSHMALSHMALSHRALSHMALSHMALSHRALSHMALSHMALSHRALSHMALSHMALSHMALSHMALSHMALSHMALSHMALSHMALSHMALSHMAPCYLFSMGCILLSTLSVEGASVKENFHICTLSTLSLPAFPPSCLRISWNGPNPWVGVPPVQVAMAVDAAETSIANSSPSLTADAALLVSLSRFEHLTSLTISKCVLDPDDEDFLYGLGSACPKLTYLDLNNEDEPGLAYEGLDALFTGCTALQYLSLTMTTIYEDGCDLPPSFFGLSSLTEVTLNFDLAFLPDEFDKLRSLTKLALTVLHNDHLPESIAQLTRLTELQLLRSSGLTDLPQNVDRLSSLEHLELGQLESITRLPDTLSKLTNLRTFSFNCNTVEAVSPSLLRHWSSLTTLEFGWPANCVTCQEDQSAFTKSICRLSNLKTLVLFGLLDLYGLPDEMGNLSQLQRLTISSCPKLMSVPDSLSSLTSLKTLVVTACPKLAHAVYDTISKIPNLESGRVDGRELGNGLFGRGE